MVHPLSVPFVSFWLKYWDDLDARTHISSNPLWVSPRFGGAPRCPAIIDKNKIISKLHWLFLFLWILYLLSKFRLRWLFYDEPINLVYLQLYNMYTNIHEYERLFFHDEKQLDPKDHQKQNICVICLKKNILNL